MALMYPKKIFSTPEKSHQNRIVFECRGFSSLAFRKVFSVFEFLNKKVIYLVRTYIIRISA